MASDSVARTHLTARFGLVTAAFGVGLTVGLVVGHILWTFHNKAPFGAAMGLNLLGFFIACCCVHETLDEVDRKPSNSIWQAYVSSLGLCRRQSNVFAIFVFYFCVHLAGTIHVVMYFYANYRFGWQLSDMLVFVSFQGFCLVFCMTVALTLLVRMDPTNRYLVLGAFILQATVLAATTATTRGWQLYLLFAIGMLHAVGFPALRSICHQLVHPKDHGTLHGRLAAISTAAVILGVPCAKHIMRWSISDAMKMAHPRICPLGYRGVLDDRSRLNCGGMPSMIFAVAASMLLVVVAFAYLIVVPHSTQRSRVVLQPLLLPQRQDANNLMSSIST